MANAYGAPDFDIDTDIDHAGLVALKGGALALTDNIYIVNDATVDLDVSCSLLKIYLGETSAGDPGAGDRVGHVQCLTAGVTITFAGAAAEVNSGIESNPVATGAETLGNSVRFEGAPGNLVTLTNNGDAMNVLNRWQINMVYGSIIETRYTDFRQMGRDGIELHPHTTHGNVGTFMENCSFCGIENGDELISVIVAAAMDLPIEIARGTYTVDAGCSVDFLALSPGLVGSGFIHMDMACVNGSGGAEIVRHDVQVNDGSTGYFRFNTQAEDFRPSYPGIIQPIIDGDATKAYVNGVQT